MTKEMSLIIEELTMEKFKSYTFDMNVDYKNRQTWNEDLNKLWQNAKATVYYNLRKEASLKRNDFWLNKVDSGILQDILKKYGFYVKADGSVYCIDAGKAMLKAIMERIVIPEIEETTGIKGIKVRKGAGPCAKNCLDFDKAHLETE